jgi:hypothetical protein
VYLHIHNQRIEDALMAWQTEHHTVKGRDGLLNMIGGQQVSFTQNHIAEIAPSWREIEYWIVVN